LLPVVAILVMRTFAEVIDAFGVAVVAKMLDLEESHVRTMKARNSIPPEYWGQLIEEAPKHGIVGLDYRKFRRLRQSRFVQEARAS
jgi:hypothetical protein